MAEAAVATGDKKPDTVPETKVCFVVYIRLIQTCYSWKYKF